MKGVVKKAIPDNCALCTHAMLEVDGSEAECLVHKDFIHNPPEVVCEYYEDKSRGYLLC